MSQIQSLSTLTATAGSDAVVARLARAAVSRDEFAQGASAFVAAFGDAMMISLAVAPALAGAALVLQAFGVPVL